MNIKADPGDKFYKAYVDFGDEYGSGTPASFWVEEWIITSHRNNKVYALHKTKYSENRQSWSLASEPPKGFAKSPQQAITLALPELDLAIKRLEKLRATMLGRRTKLRKAKK